MEAVIPNVFPLKLKSLGCSATLISVFLTTLPGVAMLFWNPIIATWSDRHRGRWGRRIPFLLAGAPCMALILVGIGWCDPIGGLLTRFTGGALPAATATIGVLMVLVLLFNLCNSFVLHPYYSLFNDTVPREVMGRFGMFLRVVSTVGIAAFNFWIFPHAETHYREIFVGVGIIFAAAYALMCFNVKEGDYPPPPPPPATRSLTGFVTTYFRECFGHPFYWYIGLASAFTVVGNAAMPFILLMNKSLGLDLKQIGWISGYAALISLPVYAITGLVIDRMNVVKTFFYGRIAQTTISACFLIYLFVDLSPRQVLVVTVILNLAMLVVTAVMMVQLVPMGMRLMPRERYGQFNSAVSVVVGISSIFAGFLMGGFIDLMRWVHHGSDFAYRYAPVWLAVFYGAATYFQYRITRYVRGCCGDDLNAFVPPDTIAKSSAAGEKKRCIPESQTTGTGNSEET
jgi:Na+/melibiose symporter-like transporter